MNRSACSRRFLSVFLALMLVVSGITTLAPATPVAAAGILTVSVRNLAGEPLNAYNLVVDSNINGMSTASPSVATVMVRFCNTGDAPLTNVTGYIGDFDTNKDGNITTDDFTVGIYPPRNTSDAGFSTQHPALMDITPTTYRFQHIGGALGTADGARYMGTLTAGECRYQYWHFTYPLCEGNLAAPCQKTNPLASATWGESVKPQDDLWLTFDTWATSDQYPLASGVPNDSWKMTMRNEISAMANKIQPNPDGIWFNTDPNTIRPGGVITTNGVLYEFGNINQGFDNDGDMIPDYNAWAQPVGNADFDPSCFRLIRTTGYLDISRSGGNPNMILPFTDKLYFTNLPPDNTGVRGYVHYTFLALGGPCNVALSPYQEVASGRDNEKFNADYGKGPDPLSTPLTEMTISKNGPASVAMNTTYTYNIPFANPGSQDIGITLSSGFGVEMPLGIVDKVPAGLRYVCGSASASFTNYSGSYRKLFSNDGVTWKESTVANNSDIFYAGSPMFPGTNCPTTNPQSTTSAPIYIRWELTAPLPKQNGATVSSGVATFQARAEAATFISGGGSPVVTNEACAKLATAGVSLACGSTTTLIQGTNSIGNFVWRDLDKDGVQDGGVEIGIPNINVKLYWDQNGNGAFDATDVFLFQTSTDSNGLYCLGAGADNTCNTADDTLPDAKYVVVIDSNDTDLPAGYVLTTRKVIPIDLDSAQTNPSRVYNDTADFGFGPVLTLDKALTSSNPAYVGENVQFKLDLVNTLPGTSGGYCQYRAWAGEVSAGTPATDSPPWVAPNNAVGSYDEAYATLTLGTNTDKLGLSRFNTGSTTGGNISKVELWIYFREMAEFQDASQDDRVFVQPYYGNAVLGTSVQLDFNYFNQTAPANYLYKLDVTSRRSWTLADFAPGTALTELEISGTKGNASIKGTIGVDAAMYVITTDRTDCGQEGVIATLPVTDTYDADLLEFVAADPPASAVVVKGTAPNSTGTITWTNVGPLYPGEANSILVTFKALATIASPGTTNYAAVRNAKFDTGRPVNQVEDSAQAYIQTPSSIAGTIWADTDEDGWTGTSPNMTSKESGEAGIPNVEVELWACVNNTTGLPMTVAQAASNKPCEDIANNGTWTLMTVTRTNTLGNYKFSGLRDGFYNIKVDTSTLPAGFTLQTGEANNYTGGASGINSGFDTYWSSPTANLSDSNFNPLSAENVTRIDFGFTNPAGTNGGVFGYIWNDADNGGYNDWDATETPIPGVDVYLCLSSATPPCTSSNAVATATTNEFGFYSFNRAAGNYIIGVDSNDLPGMTQSASPDDTVGTCDPSNCNGQKTTFAIPDDNLAGAYNFGYTGGLKIGDTVYVDWNSDGSQNATTEEGIGGVTVYLYRDIDGDGVLDAGEPLLATTATLYNIIDGYLDVNNDGSITSADDGMIQGYTIIDGAVDTDRNGTIGAGDTGTLGGYTVINGRLDVNGGGVDTTDDASKLGWYEFTKLAGNNNKYIVVVNETTIPSGYVQTGDPDESGMCVTCDAMDPLTLGTSDYLAADFGYRPTGTASIGDRVWKDNDADGVQDTYEVGIGGVAVYLYQDQDSDGVLDPEDAVVIETTTTINYQVVDGCIDIDGDGVFCSDTGDAAMAGTGLMGVKVYGGRLDMDGDGRVAYKVIDGAIDINGDGTITTADDFPSLYGKRIIDGRVDFNNDGLVTTADDTGVGQDYLGYRVIDGYLDIDNDNATAPDTGDDSDWAVPDEGDDGTYFGYAVIDGKLDMNGSGTVTTADDSSALIGMYQFTRLPAGSFIVKVENSNFDQVGDPLYALQQTNIQTPPGIENQHKVTLTTGQAYTAADFGYTNGAIGDLIWQDNNGNGSWDTGEPGISGVRVWLYIDQNNNGIYDAGTDTPYDYDGNGTAGNLGDSVTTDSSGIYRFIGLPASATDKPYLVVIDPAMFTSGQPLDSTKFTLTYDPDGPTWDTSITPRPTYPPCGTGVGYDKCNNVSQVPLLLGQMDYGQDFGYQPLLAIGDTVWIDTNGNGVRDTGESGIANVNVYLCSDAACATKLRTTSTDLDGLYSFGGLSDNTTYYVMVETNRTTDPDFPANLTNTYDPDGTNNAVTQVSTSGGKVTTVGTLSGCGVTQDCALKADFGFQYTGSASISGYVFNDVGNNGGTPGVGYVPGTDIPIAGVPVYLWSTCGPDGVCGNSDDVTMLVAETTTAVDGSYSFTGLRSDTYRVAVGASAPQLKEMTLTYEPDVVDGYCNTSGDNCNVNTTVVIGASVTNKNFGFYAAIDYGDLLDSYRTTTAYGGAGHIIPTGSTLYLGAARQTEANGRPTFDATGEGNEEDGVTFKPGQVYRGGNTLTFEVTIAGANGYLVAFFDWNGDGDFADAGEIVNFANQAAGTRDYTVNVPAGADSGSMLNARFRLYDSTQVTSYGADGLAVNGEVEDYQWKFGSIGDYVWMDLDRDGFQDASEPGLPNVKVNLYKSDGTTLLASTYTDSAGRYRFETLGDGDYVVKVDTTTLPNGGTNIVNTYDPDQPGGGDSASGVIALAAGQRVDTADFGYAPSATKAAIGDYVWSDADNDGIQDPGEPGIEGVTVALKNAATGALMATTTTDAAGRYLFTNIDPGEYIVDVTDTGGKLAGYTLKVGPQSSTDPTAPIKVRAGDVYLEADFGYYKSGLGSISNQVWLDFNGNGLFEGGETGLSGVQVMLIKDSDGDGVRDAGEPVIATAVTAADGAYTFTGLPLDYGSGNAKYLVVVGDTNVALRDYIKTTGASATADSYSKSEPYAVTLSSGTPTNVTADFGYRYPLNVNGLIGDRVWFDLDGDGVQDEGEAGIPGVTVYLCTSSPCGSGNAIRTTTTDVNGNYYFPSLPAGTYYVAVDTSTLKGGVTVNTFDDDTDYDSESGAINLAAGQTYVGADFGYDYATAGHSIGDKVWRDDNTNGRDDESTTGISGVTLALYKDNNSDGLLDSGDTLLATDTTDSSGIYGFNGLPAGDYIVDVTDEYGVLFGYRQTAGNDPWPVLIKTASRSDIDFGYVREAALGSIGDTVWFDVDGDGEVDPVEKGLPGVKVWLYVDMDNDGIFDPDDGDGVCETGEDCIYDYDGDSTRGDADDSVLTGHDGVYRFGNLPAGNYFVVVEGDGSTTGNFASGKPLNGLASTTGGQVSAVIHLSEGERYLEADFGYRNSSGTYSIGDFVWADADADGIQDPGEPGIAGVLVELFNASNVSQGTATTDAYGYYRFTGITTAGVYYVRVRDSNFTSGQPLEGYTVTSGPESQGNNQSKAYQLNDTTPSVDKVDFGFDNASLGSIGDRVWLDFNKDGNQDTGEPGLKGIYVDLISGGNVIATTVTDANGNYSFTGLKYGAYTVRVEDRDNLLQGMTLTTAGAFDRTVSAGTPNHTDADFGFNDPTIGDFVWLDDGDGIQETGESGIQGVKVLLYRDIDGDGVIDPGVDNLIMTRYTNEDGYYYFGELPFNTTYIIKLDDSNFASGGVLEGFKTTLQNQGGDDAKDSDAAANLTSGVQIAITTPGLQTEDFTLDFGLLCTTCRTIGNLVWQDLDAPATSGHGYKDTDESGLDGVTLVLYRDLDGDGAIDEDDPVVGKTTTSGGGSYAFSNLPPDTYIVQVTDENFVLKGFVWSDGTYNNGDNYSHVTTYAVNITSGDVNYADFGFYQYPEAPTAVTLADFSATAQADGILLTWETAAELDNVGFNLYRSTSVDGPYTLLNATLIPPQFPGEVIGGIYAWLDADVQPGISYYYKLEDVDVKGVSTFHGPVTVTARATTAAPGFKVFLPLVMAQH